MILAFLAREAVGAATLWASRLAEQFESHLFHDFDTPVTESDPDTLPLPGLITTTEEITHVTLLAGCDLTLPTESDYLNGEPTEFEQDLAGLIVLHKCQDADLIDYLHQCINAWGRA